MANYEQLEELRNIMNRWWEETAKLSSPRNSNPYYRYSEYFNKLREEGTPIDFSNTILGKEALGTDTIRMEEFADVNFSGTQFEGLTFSGEDLQETVSFVDANLTHAHFKDCGFYRVDLRRAEVKGAQFKECQFFQTYFRRLDLHDTRFENVSIEDCDLSGTNFCGVDLSTVEIEKIDLAGGDIEGLSVSKETILPKQPPEWLKQLHDVASREGGTGYAVWRDGKAVKCAEPQTQFDANAIEVTPPVKKRTHNF